VSRERLDVLAAPDNVAVTQRDLTARQTGGRKIELWRPILVIFAVVLCTEQLLAWTFDRRRNF
jgi:hypothetical protein